jgi:hypothetical protein
MEMSTAPIAQRQLAPPCGFCADNATSVRLASLLAITFFKTQGLSVQRGREEVEPEDEAANAPP